ncbi:M15 family metallopeptidase [Argonema galeatum]|uniref:M15 family metallopeptidase n=1 Tax=Argonema galeatum TaxID=2942762 RepID=UPI002011EF83|nr:M15 family metallopeptidase [Argonema galeatum]MCL1468265.1 M15 family metallopeptidase [Argonema galeatum A003/A1]
MSRWVKLFTVTLLVVLFLACQKSDSVPSAESEVKNTTSVKASTLAKPSPAPQAKITLSPKIDNAQLVDIGTINRKIVQDIRYATENNFTKRKLYPVARCLLRGEVALKLSQVQEDLEKQGLGLKVYDCYRPLSVQKLMWKIPSARPYVANPAKGSKHNRGAAVDITLVDSNGQELEMPTEFDNFTPRAHRKYRGASAEAKRNRSLLEEAMKKRGFIPLPKEWWHFDAVGWQKYEILDVLFQSIP